ncbi:MAG TPA: DNA recombination protein RmuC [Alphaproteobacteria bacterium]|nr:DNA recombination protein RmuC [Alphaproteobacteria bacterium]
MNTILFDPVSGALGLAAGVLAGLGAGLLIALWRAAALRARIEYLTKDQGVMDGAFRASAQEVLKGASEQFLILAKERLGQAQAEGSYDLEKRQKAVADIVDPIAKTLKDMEGKIETLGKAGSGIESQLRLFAEDQRLLRQETHHLVNALRNPAARGRWGEMQLARTLQMVGMVEGVHYVQQTAVRADGASLRPDFVIRLPGGMEIVIDVKAPMEPYWKALEEAGDETARAAAAASFRSTVRNHLRLLSGKEYWRSFNAPEFVVMFLPTESLYSLAITSDPELLEEAARARVIIASPTTVMGLLRVAMYGWQQQKLADEARRISDMALELYRRVGKFGEHMVKVGRNLDTAVGAYNQAVGSLESMVLPGVRRLKDYQPSAGASEIPEIKPLETGARPLAAPELLSTGTES